MAQRPKELDCLLPLAESTYNAAYHKSFKTSTFRGEVGFEMRMLLGLLVPIPCADCMMKIILEADEFAEQMLSACCMYRVWLEDVQTEMIREANMSCCKHDFEVRNSVIL